MSANGKGLTVLAGLALAVMAWTTAAAPAGGDGFLYPGDPAAKGARAYNERWDAYMAHLRPQIPERQPAPLAWMIGRWTAALREMGPAATTQRDAQAWPPMQAVVTPTPDGRWMRIEADQPGGATWTWYLGHDRTSDRWTLYAINSPAVVTAGTPRAEGWMNNRLVFAPLDATYRGFRSTVRYTVVRDGPNRFRIVTEVLTSPGVFVAMDDALFVRAP